MALMLLLLLLLQNFYSAQIQANSSQEALAYSKVLNDSICGDTSLISSLIRLHKLILGCF